VGEVINLRLVRKQRARVAAGVRATENRRVFGRTAAEKAADTAARNRIEKILDGAQLYDRPANATSDKS
jgi:hypothetical protein